MQVATIAKSALIAAVAFGLSTGCCKNSEKHKKVAGKQRVEYVASLRAVQNTLAGSKLLAPDKCPKLAEKGKGYGDWDGYAKTATPGLFAKLDGKGWSEDELETWGWLNNDWLEEVILEESNAKKASNKSRFHISILARSPYIVIFKARRKAMPKVGGDKGFSSGYFEGDLIVFERQTGKALCRTTLKAESSDQVSHKKRGLGAKSAEEALIADFRDQFKKAAKASLKKIAPTLKISL